MDNTDVTGDHRSVFRRRGVKILFVLGATTLLAGLGALCLLIKVNQPVQGMIVKTARPALDNSSTSLKILSGQYYKTRYPSNYELQPKPSNSASLESDVLIDHRQGRFGTGSRITLTIEPAPEGGVTESSSYKLFESEPDINVLAHEQYNGEDVIVSTRISPDYEKTVLWLHGDYLLTVTLVASAQTSTEDAGLQTILDNVQW